MSCRFAIARFIDTFGTKIVHNCNNFKKNIKEYDPILAMAIEHRAEVILNLSVDLIKLSHSKFTSPL